MPGLISHRTRVHVSSLPDPQKNNLAVLREQIRLVKAALLYADTVTTTSLRRAMGPSRQSAPSDAATLSSERVFMAVGQLLAVELGDSDPRELRRLDPAEANQAQVLVADLLAAHRAGGLRLPGQQPTGDELEESQRVERDFGVSELKWLRGTQVPMLAASGVRRQISSSRREWEGFIAEELLGSLEGFPDATMDVILDVRERIAGARIHFRAAIAEAAKEVAETSGSVPDPHDVVADLRVRVVDPALREIAEELEALGARRTLLRVASDRVALSSTAASITVAAGAGGGLAGLGALAQAALAGPVVAAVAKEGSFRADVRSQVSVRPYWLLHEAGERLAVR